MHPYDALQEKTVYVLLGRFENNLGRQCVFVEAAICLEEIAFEGECPVWSDDSWAYLYKKLKHAYDNMVIVGWAMDIRGQLPNLTVAIEKLHRTYFGGEHQILYLMDSLEKEDAFYSLKNGYLKRRAGYYIYYEQKQSDLSAVIEEKREKDTEIKEEEYEKERTNSYRNYLRKKEQKTKLIPSYGLSILLFFVVCGLGFAAFQNHQKMNAMETALMQMNHATAAEAETETEESASEENVTVKVESVEGNITPQDDTQTAGQNGMQTDVAQLPAESDAADSTQTAEQDNTTVDTTLATAESVTTQSGAQPATENNTAQQSDTQTNNATAQTSAASSEAAQYLSQGYYIVQKGDSLVGICRKVYNTTAMMDKLCETNGIENPDAIYEGQYLTLPN